MKVTDFKVVEARMTPGEYKKAIQKGQAEGVLVGFEFEVIVDTEKRKQIVQGASVEPGAPYQVPFGTQTILKFCQEFGRNTNPSVLNFDKYIEARRPLNESGTTGLGATYIRIHSPAIITRALEQIVDNASQYIAHHMAGDFSRWPDVSRTYSGSRPELLARLKEILADAGIPVGSQELTNFAIEPDTSIVRRMDAFRTLQDAVNILTDRFKQLKVGSGDNQLYQVKYQWRDDPESEWDERVMQVVASSESEAQGEARDRLSNMAYTGDSRAQFRAPTVIGVEPTPVDPNGQQPWQTERGIQTIIDYNLVNHLYNYLWTRDSLRRSFYLDHTEFRRAFATWVEQRYGLKRMADLVYNGGVARGQQIPPGLKVVEGQDQAVANISGGRNPDWNPNRNAGLNGYKAGAEFIKSLLEPMVQRPVHIFTSYHQSRKNLTDYYIEPDGSLRPRPGDSSAEVVSPPLPPVDAMNMLNRFFAMAKSNGMYTGKDYVTGLHINVSIPKQLDVLKLAMFVGDEYVLKQFGRENAQYVHSIYKSLLNNNAPAPGISQEQRMQYVKKIASDFANSHGASTSFESGKYISFRHAGGDYLNNPELVNNTVGRFVRAMIIASDPLAYRNEYLAKVTKLSGEMRIPHGRLRRPQDPITARGELQRLAQTGLQGATAVFFIWNDPSSFESLSSGIGAPLPFNMLPNGVTIENGTEQDRQTLAAARGWSTATKEKLLAAPLEQIKQAQIIFQNPDVTNQWSDYGKAVGLRDRGNRIGAIVYQPMHIPPNDPRVRAMMQQHMRGTVAGPQGVLPESRQRIIYGFKSQK